MGFTHYRIKAKYFIPALCIAVLLTGCKKDDTGGKNDGEDDEELAVYTPEQVREALVDIYNATGGSNWTDNGNWCSDEPISKWKGISVNAQGEVTSISLATNNLSGTLPDVFDRFPRLRTLNLNGNTLKGPVPQTLRLLREEGFSANLSHNTFETTTFKVANSRIESVSMAMRVYPSDNPSFRFYVDSNLDGKGKTRADAEVQVLHKAEEGNGFDLVIIGEGFDKDELTVGGTCEFWCKKAADAHFQIDPLDKLYKYFNVYIIYNISPNRGVSLGSDKINTRFHYTQGNLNAVEVTTFDYSPCKKFIERALGRSLKANAVVCVVPNCTQNAIIGGIEKRVSSVAWAFCPTRASHFDKLVRHESAGHGIGHLIDEYDGNAVYIKEEGTKNPVADAPNGDIESDPTLVKWAQFIADPRYAGEDLGVFEGCKGYKSGVYRPSQTSMMNSSSVRNDFFNAPSRASIYSWVMQTALGEDFFTYDFETFAKWDKGE